MSTTRWTTLLAVAAVGFALAWLGLSAAEAAGVFLLEPPVTVIVVTALLAVGTLATAWPLRRWNTGHRDRPIRPLRAARTVALAKAAGLTGAFVTGAWLAGSAITLPRIDGGAQLDRVLAFALAVVVSLALFVCGVVAERWCRIPPEDDGASVGGLRSPSSAA